jgi:tetratricopeptide (TPR) repeat protein
VGELGFRSTVDSSLAAVLVGSGRHDEAEVIARDVLSYATEDDFDPHSRARWVLARVFAARGELEEAERLAREAVGLVEPTDYLEARAETLLGLGDVLERAGRVAEAAEAVLAATELYERKGDLVMSGRARAHLERLRAPA